MMRQSITLVFAAMFAFATSAAFANEGYSALDADKSGTISKEEAATLPGLTDAWDTLDANTDGQLDEGEFAKFEVDIESADDGVVEKLEGAVDKMIDAVKE